MTLSRSTAANYYVSLHSHFMCEAFSLQGPNQLLIIILLDPVGCQTKIQTEREEDIRICRNCHNGQ